MTYHGANGGLNCYANSTPRIAAGGLARTMKGGAEWK
jgi:hypothetical protein